MNNNNQLTFIDYLFLFNVILNLNKYEEDKHNTSITDRLDILIEQNNKLLNILSDNNE